MKKYIRPKYLLLAIFLVSIVSIAAVSSLKINGVCAQSLWDRQQGKEEIGMAFGESDDTPTDIRVVTINIIKVFLTFIGIIAVIYILLAGYKWMTAAGNQDQVAEAKKMIQNAIIGVIIIIAAYTITTFVGNCVLKAFGNDTWMC